MIPPRGLVYVSIQKHKAGALEADAAADDTIQAYEACIPALERLVDRQAPELTCLHDRTTLSQQPQCAA